MEEPRRLLGDGRGASPEDRQGVRRAAWANVAGNAAKILVEGSLGLVSGSVALLADAAHSVADLFASVVVLVYGSRSYAEADLGHQHGHQRLEPLAALTVGGAIVLIALLLLRESAVELLRESAATYTPLMVAGLGFAAGSMALVYGYTRRVNAAIGSQSLDALARDCLNDIYTTAAAAVGVAGLAVGRPMLDPLAGGLVALLVLYQGVDIVRDNVHYLAGAAPSEQVQRAIRETVESHDAVVGYHDLAAHYVGPEVEVEMHVEVAGDMTVQEAHDIETEIATALREIEEVGDVHIHIDPEGIGEWKTGTGSASGEAEHG